LASPSIIVFPGDQPDIVEGISLIVVKTINRRGEGFGITRGFPNIKELMVCGVGHEPGNKLFPSVVRERPALGLAALYISGIHAGRFSFAAPIEPIPLKFLVFRLGRTAEVDT